MRRRAHSACNSIVDSSLTSPLTFGFYTIQANGGDVYQFRTARPDTSGGFTPSAEIFDSQGTRVGVLPAGSASGHAASTATITFPRSGTYSVIVSGPLDGSLGAYSLSTPSPQPALRWRCRRSPARPWWTAPSTA